MSAANDNPVVALVVALGEQSITVTGRPAWALDILIARGEKGITPVEAAHGHRWAAYVYKLKKNFGIGVRTVTERHKGAFAGNHARYVLDVEAPLSVVKVVRKEDKANVAA